MKLIAHRGNTHGRNAERENSPTYIKEALATGYDAEIDVWYINNWSFWLDLNILLRTIPVVIKAKGAY